MGFGWERHPNRITHSNHSAADDNGHHTVAEQLGADLRFERNRVPQPRLKFVDLGTRIAEPGEGDDDVLTQPKRAADRKFAEIQIAGRQVFAEGAKRNIESVAAQSLMNFAGHEVDLPEVGTVRVFLPATEMLRCRAGVSVTLDPETGDEHRLVDTWFGKVVLTVEMKAVDSSFERMTHESSLPCELDQFGELHDPGFDLREFLLGEQESPEHGAVMQSPSVEPVGHAGIGVGENHPERTVGLDLGLNPVE